MGWPPSRCRYLSNNNITSIPSNAFANLSALNTLYVVDGMVALTLKVSVQQPINVNPVERLRNPVCA